MAVPIRHKDILKNYVDNASNAAWARDLVSLAVKTGGVMTDAEHMMVLTEFENGTTVTPALLKEVGLVNKELCGIKVLGNGTLEKKLTVQANKFSKTAKEKIEASGSKIEVM